MMGKTVVIVSPDKHLGGLSSGGLGFTDTGNKAVIGGLAREFYHRVWQHYDQPDGLEVAEARGVRQQGPGHSGDRRRAAHDVDLRAARRRAGLRGTHQRARHSRASRRMARPRKAASRRAARASRRSRRSAARRYAGKMFIDATYEGDLMAAAGVDYHVGPRSQQRLRREMERRADRRAASPPSFRRGEAEDQPLRRPRRSKERRAAAHQHRAAGRIRCRATSGCRPIASACA